MFDKVSKIEAAGSGMSLIGHSLLLLRDIGIDIDGGEWQFRSKCAGNNENPANDQANSTQIDRDETAGQVADSLPMPLGLRQNDVSLRRSDGTIVLQTPTESGDQFIVGAFGSVQYNCHRGELQQALLRRAIQVGVLVRTGERVQGIRQWLGSKDVEGWVEVLLEKGVYVEGCAVIGADGVHSVVRESLRRGSFRKDWTQHGHGIDHEDNEKDKKKKAKANMSTRVDEEEIVYEGGAAVPTLRYCGYSCWRGLTSDTSCFTSAREHPVMYKTVAHEGGGQVSFTVGRMPRGRVFWVCDIGYGERQENPEDIHKFIVQAVGKGACGEIEKVIRSTPASAIVRTNIHEVHITCYARTELYYFKSNIVSVLRSCGVAIVSFYFYFSMEVSHFLISPILFHILAHIKTTYHPRVHIGIGRVALIGDAAHAMVHHFGQGACMAIEDSFRLAMCYEKALLAAKSGIEMKGLPFCGRDREISSYGTHNRILRYWTESFFILSVSLGSTYSIFEFRCATHRLSVPVC